MNHNKFEIKTSSGTYVVSVELSSNIKDKNVNVLYDNGVITSWISNFWWETPAEEKDEKANKDADPPKPKHCWHDWKEYLGFTERYWYCEKCDEKSKENPNKCF
jgi:hypothetical protein